MALIPYLMDYDLRPRSVRDDLFGLDNDLADFFEMPVIRMRRYARPWRNLAAAARDVGSTIKSDKDKFQVNLDVQHFAPEEVSVKTVDGYVVVEGKHEEKKDEHGFISREFKRRYALPEGCDPEAVTSKLSTDGVLTITAPKTSGNSKERAVPITHTGPVRRKHAEEEEINGQVDEVEEETKTPQKRRKR